MTNVSKRNWGNSVMKYCPIKKKVWQLKYDTANTEHIVVVHRDMPTYGLERLPIPEDLRIEGA